MPRVPCANGSINYKINIVELHAQVDGPKEAHMEAYQKHRIALFNYLSKECAAYELVLKEDLAQRR